jgi:membrane protein
MRGDVSETLRQVCRAWNRFGCTSLAAAVAYYAALSLFPLLLLLLAGMGWFFESVKQGVDAREQLMSIVSRQFSPWAAEQLEVLLNGLQDAAPRTGPLAGLGLIVSGSLVFRQIDRGFAEIWEARRPPAPKHGWWKTLRSAAFQRLRSVLLIGVVFGVVTLVALAGTLLRTLDEVAERWLPGVQTPSGLEASLIGLAVSTLVFGILYRLLSRRKVRWRLCFVAGAIAAVLWEAGGWAMGAASFGNRYSALGIVGSFLVVVLWIHYNAVVLFAGALLVRVRSWPLDDE